MEGCHGTPPWIDNRSTKEKKPLSAAVASAGAAVSMGSVTTAGAVVVVARFGVTSAVAIDFVVVAVSVVLVDWAVGSCAAIGVVSYIWVYCEYRTFRLDHAVPTDYPSNPDPPAFKMVEVGVTTKPPHWYWWRCGRPSACLGRAGVFRQLCGRRVRVATWAACPSYSRGLVRESPPCSEETATHKTCSDTSNSITAHHAVPFGLASSSWLSLFELCCHCVCKEYADCVYY